MTLYKLVTIEDSTSTRDVGENIFFDDLDLLYEVYLFYYPGTMPDPVLEGLLRNLGKDAGRNLFVNIGRINDPKYKQIVKIFEIRTRPVVIMTANETLSSIADDNSKSITAYARIDSKKLFASPEKTAEVVDELHNLFISGRVAEALSAAKGAQRESALLHLKNEVLRSIRGVVGSLDEIEIGFSYLDGIKFRIKTK
jgi:hypothetical protein